MEPIIQNTPEWYAARRGIITSSQVYRLMTDPKLKADKEAGELSEGAKTYIMELIAEELGLPRKEVETEAMRWGSECESIFEDYMNRRNWQIYRSDFITSNIEGYGGSPDYIGLNDVFELKCPYNSSIHLKYCLIESPKDIPAEYYWQCVSNAYLTQRMFIVFASFDPRINHDIGLKLFHFDTPVEDMNRMIERIKKALEYKSFIKQKLGL